MIWCRLAFIVLFSSLLPAPHLKPQSIKGNFPVHNSHQIELIGFKGFETYLISTIRADEEGKFKLKYTEDDYGVGILKSGRDHQFITILSGEDIHLKGDALGFTETIQIKKGLENQQFDKYARQQPLRENALSAWHFLKNLYISDSLFWGQNKAQQNIENEIKRLQNDEKAFLNSLDPESYVRWFLPVRKLVSTVGTIAQHRPQQIHTAYTAFRNLDYADSRLYKSGLLKEAVENHFWLIENSAGPLDSVFKEMKISIDVLLEFLIFNEKRLNEISSHLFNYLESRSLFKASEYLAFHLLNQEICLLERDLAHQLESYRKMKVGNIAPDIKFGEFTNFPEGLKIASLSKMDFNFILIVFAAGWCPHCTREIPEIADLYSNWKEFGVEVVLVSLDETSQKFSQFTGELPFISTTDYKKWESPIVDDYFVFGVPSMFLLNRDREIIQRINSARQMDAWVDWKLKR